MYVIKAIFVCKAAVLHRLAFVRLLIASSIQIAHIQLLSSTMETLREMPAVTFVIRVQKVLPL